MCIKGSIFKGRSRRMDSEDKQGRDGDMVKIKTCNYNVITCFSALIELSGPGYGKFYSAAFLYLFIMSLQVVMTMTLSLKNCFTTGSENN